MNPVLVAFQSVPSRTEFVAYVTCIARGLKMLRLNVTFHCGVVKRDEVALNTLKPAIVMFHHSH